MITLQVSLLTPVKSTTPPVKKPRNKLFCGGIDFYIYVHLWLPRKNVKTPLKPCKRIKTTRLLNPRVTPTFICDTFIRRVLVAMVKRRLLYL